MSGLRYLEGLDTDADPLDRFSDAIACSDQGAYVVMYSRSSDVEPGLSVEEMTTRVDLDVVAIRADGDIYLARARPNAHCPESD